MKFVPQKFGKFTLLDKIASGGMAEIFMAQTAGPGGFEKIVALKRILPSFGGHQEFISMFIEEAKITSQLTHSNIVQIYEFGEIDNTYYLSMEFVDGKNLRQLLSRCEELKHPMPLEHAVFIAHKIGEGLDYAHRFQDKKAQESLHIIHRDVSPQNILISYEGEIKLIDFGIAKIKAHEGRTKSGVLKGKFSYMSPEQASGEPIDQRSDIFSIGIILFEMLTRQRLFAGPNDAATLKKIQEAKIPAPSLFNPDVPFELEEIVFKALTKDPAKRYQTAKDFHRELTRFLHTLNPDFTASHLAAFIRSLFSTELMEHKKHMNEVLSSIVTVHEKPQKLDEEIHPLRSAQGRQDSTPEAKTQPQGKKTLPLKQISQDTEETYNKKVLLQLGIMGFAVIVLSLLLLALNQHPERIIQSVAPIKATTPPPQDTQTPPQSAVPKLSTLRIDTAPQGADVYLDDILMGQTPLTLPRQSQHRSLKLVIKKEGFEVLQETISLTSSNYHIMKNLVSQRFGFLNIKTVPEKSDIFIDGKFIQTTPIVKYRIPAGKHAIKAVHTEFNLIAEKEIDIEADEIKVIDENELVFKPQP
ncbi:MAG: serine/threonine protein kinase [Deltaproteobacteria bacterium]|nr:serine/threonine protein kinase [Deltaproteobacteria bacterium]